MKKVLIGLLTSLMTLALVLSIQLESQEVYALRDPLTFIQMALDPDDYVIGIALGASHSSAWTSDGEVWMWGWDTSGQLGDGGTNTDQDEPVEITSKFTVNAGEKIVGVALGDYHSAAWTSDGDIWTWGNDYYGELGDGGTDTAQDEPVEITSKFTVNAGEKIVGIALGNSHSAAWTSDGDVWTWGKDTSGQLGDGGTNTAQDEPVEITSKFTVNAGEKIVGIALGASHSSAWTSDGEVWMWGYDYYGQLGDGGTNTNQDEPVEITSKFTVNAGEKIVGIALGGNHSSAWTSDGEVWMWGYDYNGQLGDGGTNTEQDEPVEITSKFTVNAGEKIVGIALGGTHSSAWTSDGDVWTWGKDTSGQLGDGGTNTEQDEPVEITSKFTVNAGEKIVGVALGGNHSSAWTSDGDVWTWGDAGYGQLGDGQIITDRIEPYLINSTGDLEPGEPASFTVTYDSNGGSSVASEEVDDGELATEPADPTRTYYTFDGWYTDDGVWTDEWIFGTDTVTEDITLYAKWVLNEWTVTYDSNGGSAKSPDDYDYGETLVEPSDPTRAGYYFDGWFYDDDTFASEVDWGTDTMPNNDLTLYADWSAKPLYTVTFDTQGGSAIDSQSVYDEEYASEPATDPTRLYYTFDGWYTSLIYTTPYNFATMAITANTTIYAKWVWQKVVTFDSNGGSEVDTQYIDDGELAIEPDDPTRTGYGFDAWYTDDSTFLNEFNFGTTAITADITLYANWEINTWTVTFDSNGGTAVDSQFVDFGGLITKPPNPTRTGYGFVGWYETEDLLNQWQWNVDAMPNESITLHAKWQKNIDGVIDDFVTDADIGDTGKLAMALGAIMVTAIIFVLVGLQAVMTIMLMVIMFTLFLALGWIPGWMAVIMAIILFGMLFIIIKGNGGGSE